MPSPPKKCPRCGAEIPSGVPAGTCPSCALRDALGMGAYDVKNVDPQADTVPIRTAEKERSRISQTMATQRRLKKVLFASRWVVAAVLAVIVAYTLVRHVQMANTIRPNLYFTEDLRLKFESAQLGLSPEARLVSVNGAPVDSLDDVFTAYDAADAFLVEFVFNDPLLSENERLLPYTYLVGEIPFNFRVTRDGQLFTNATNRSLVELLGADERIAAVNGFPLDELSTSGEVTDVPAFPNREITRYYRFDLENSDAQSTRSLIVWVNSALRQRSRLLAGIGFLGIGLLVFWLRPDTRSSAGFLLFSTIVGTFYLARSLDSPYRTSFENQLYYLLQCLVPAFTAVFIFTFTPLRLLVRRPGLMGITAVALSILLLMLNSMQFPKEASIGLLGTAWFQVWAFTMLVLLILSLPMDWWLRMLRVPQGPTDKQRSRTLRFAFLVGFTPTIVYAFFAVNSSMWYELTPLFDVSVLLFPALIGYAIVRHNFLRLNELARESVLYGLLMALLVGAYVTGTSVVVPFVQRFSGEAAQWSQSIVLAVAMGLIIPVHSVTRKYIERRFKRIPFEYEQFLQAIEEDGPEWHGPADYCHMVAMQLSRMVDTANIVVLTRFPGQDEWSISATTQRTSSDDASESCKMLCALLEQEKSEVFRDDVLEGFRYRVIQREILDGMEALDASVVIPLVRHGKVIGAISLGDKSANANYSSYEMATLKRIANHVAGTLYNLMTLSTVAAGTRIADIWPDWPERVGGYDIIRPIGEGGMAYVFLGMRDGKNYAIKVANRLVQSNSRLMERFHREASAVQRLNHPNVVKIVEVGWEGPEPFIVFEYFEKGSLEQLVNPDDPLDIPTVLKFGLQMAEALQFAHEQGVIHRDIKPRNIFLTDENNIKLGDFGLAHLADRTTLTQKGEFFGTPDYLAPELLQGGKSTIQSDMYALGVTLFELLVGTRPYAGESTVAIVHQRLSTQPAKISTLRPDSPEHLVEAVALLLQVSSAQRYSSYRELIRALAGTECEIVN